MECAASAEMISGALLIVSFSSQERQQWRRQLRLPIPPYGQRKSLNGAVLGYLRLLYESGDALRVLRQQTHCCRLRQIVSCPFARRYGQSVAAIASLLHPVVVVRSFYFPMVTSAGRPFPSRVEPSRVALFLARPLATAAFSFPRGFTPSSSGPF